MDELNVKVGDKVVYYYGGYCNYCSICEVVRVTPTGRIRIKTHESIQFDKYGWEIGKRDLWRGRSKIVKLTPELEKKIIEENTIMECLSKMRNTTSVDYETAVRILKVLKDTQK